MTHDELVECIAAAAVGLGEIYHFSRDSRRATPGFPDIVVAGRRGVLFAEIKTGGGRLRERQQDWKWMLLASGQMWRCYGPDDWNSGLIQAELRQIA